MGPDPRGGVILGLLFYFLSIFTTLGGSFFWGGGSDEYICLSVDITRLCRNIIQYTYYSLLIDVIADRQASAWC